MEVLGEKLREYALRLKEKKGYFLSDIRRHQYFARNPKNDNAEDIRQKLSVINHFQILYLSCREEMVRHILALKIDVDLQADHLELVPRMAAFHFRGKEHHLLEFASEYCNAHKPTIFPIYCKRHLGLLKHYMQLYDLLKDDESLNDYFVYKNGLDHFMARYRLNELLNYYEVKKLDWLYLDKLLAEVSRKLNH